MADLYAGLDVSLELTNVCIIDGDGRLVANRMLECKQRLECGPVRDCIGMCSIY